MVVFGRNRISQELSPLAVEQGVRVPWSSWQALSGELGVRQQNIAVFAPQDPSFDEPHDSRREWMEHWAESRGALWIDVRPALEDEAESPLASALISPSEAMRRARRASLPAATDWTDPDGDDGDDPWTSLASSALPHIRQDGFPAPEWWDVEKVDHCPPEPSLLTFGFGPHSVRREQIFYETRLSVAFVNIRPVVPGHVLVSARRRVPRVADLRPDELTDMWLAAQRVGRAIERETGAISLTYAIQDGPAAGQTVPHAHIHVLPRKPNDLPNNDDIYDHIDHSERHQSAMSSPMSPFTRVRRLAPPSPAPRFDDIADIGPSSRHSMRSLGSARSQEGGLGVRRRTPMPTMEPSPRLSALPDPHPHAHHPFISHLHQSHGGGTMLDGVGVFVPREADGGAEESERTEGGDAGPLSGPSKVSGTSGEERGFSAQTGLVGPAVHTTAASSGAGEGAEWSSSGGGAKDDVWDRDVQEVARKPPRTLDDMAREADAFRTLLLGM